MHTVELLPDPALESRVRELWDRLAAAGLPSLATHRHPTNRPHLTVVTTESLAGLPVPALPMAASLTSVRMLGRALVWSVAPSDELRALYEAAWSAVGGWPPPGEWMPHLSLALRVPPDAQAAALDLLAAVAPMSGAFVAARTYDTGTRTVRDL